MKSKTQRLMNAFCIGVGLGIAGHLVNLFIIRPSLNLSSEYLNLTLINLALLPTIIVFIIGLSMSLRYRKYYLITLNIFGLLAMTLVVWYFSYPIIHPGRGL